MHGLNYDVCVCEYMSQRKDLAYGTHKVTLPSYFSRAQQSVNQLLFIETAGTRARTTTS